MLVISLTDGVDIYEQGEVLIVELAIDPKDGDVVIYQGIGDEDGVVRLWQSGDSKPWGVVVGRID